MKATIREILTHPEASKPMKLKAPLFKVTQLLRAFDINTPERKPWMIGTDIKQTTAQLPMAAPTVFNFYKPDTHLMAQ